MRNRPTVLVLAIATILALALVAPAVAQTEAAAASPAAGADSAALRSAWSPGEGALVIHHGPVDVRLADPSSDGHQVGDVRVASVETANADGEVLGRLDATLTTTAVDEPEAGDESRIGVLVFAFGEAGGDQVTVEGSAHYPARASSLATGSTVERAIVGGSGRLAGVAGSAITEHLGDGSWVHTLKLQRMNAQLGADLQASQARRKQARDEPGAEVAESTAERKTARAEAKATRDTERTEAAAQRKTARVEARAAREADRDQRASTADLYASAPDETGVIRTDLGTVVPGSTPGQELGLWHYSITPGEELAPHTHPGWQLARVTAGELEYTVLSGEGVLLRADGSSEPMGPGTYVLAPGDGVIENPELEHYGANRGEDVVTIIAATLYPAGAALATLIEAAPAE